MVGGNSTDRRRYILRRNELNMIGRRVYIKNQDSIHFNDWGIVVGYDGEYYHVAIYNDKNHVVIFKRNELHIPRKEVL